MALGRTTDRRQPMDAEANQNTCSLGDAGQCVMTGNVRITQGSLDISAAKATIFRAGGDISRALLSGSPVVLKQEMDDGTPMTARANNVDYNLSTDVVIFTGDVVIQQPRGTMSGQRVVYNLKTGNVDSGGEGGGRVKMRIMPRNAAPATPPPAPTKTTP
ncbi:lipopolysaccharide transport periplasmic protein LptA [Cognatiluteimonas profundi]|uniref:lipopolysaccharide transport periplasmic protein LptA n=1 Tax=Cognatiluteimonas profundi TaxID=2594501 RepID=UPI00131D663A|nr:lipopolysaccharide transport periplasmic protein LptA [Lysobacter profundi]